jgi:hypothetical protein
MNDVKINSTLSYNKSRFFDPASESAIKMYNEAINTRSGLEAYFGPEIVTDEEIRQEIQHQKNFRLKIKNIKSEILIMEQRNIDLKRELKLYEIGSFFVIFVVIIFFFRKHFKISI